MAVNGLKDTRMVTDKMEENVAEAQCGTAVQNNPNNNGVLATKLQTTELKSCQNMQTKMNSDISSKTMLFSNLTSSLKIRKSLTGLQFRRTQSSTMPHRITKLQQSKE